MQVYIAARCIHPDAVLKLVKTSFGSSWRCETLVGLMLTNQSMKAMGIHAHQIKLDGMLLELVQKVKSNVTDSQAQFQRNIIYQQRTNLACGDNCFTLCFKTNIDFSVKPTSEANLDTVLVRVLLDGKSNNLAKM